MPAYDHCKKMKHHLHKFLNKSKLWNTDSSKKLWEDFVDLASHLPTEYSKMLHKQVVKLGKDFGNSANRSISCFSAPTYDDRKLDKLMKKCDKIIAEIDEFRAKSEVCEARQPEELKTESNAEQETDEKVLQESEAFHDCSESFDQKYFM